TMDYIRSKLLPTGVEIDLRFKAIQTENQSEKHKPLGQPCFEARFVGGLMNGVNGFFPARLAECHPITKVKATGKVIGQEESFYQLVSQGPPVVDHFVSKKACAGVKSSCS